MIFIQYPKCSTCKKAKKWLDENHVIYEDRNIVTETPSIIEIQEIYKKSKLPLKRLFNTSGLVYKNLKLKDKLDSMSEEEQIHLLASNGMLIKRPIVVTDDIALIGFDSKIWETTLLS